MTEEEKKEFEEEIKDSLHEITVKLSVAEASVELLRSHKQDLEYVLNTI